MEGLSFIFRRFFYSFLSGCIINFYIIIYYSVVIKSIKYSSIILENIFLLINKSPNFIFIITAIFMSIIIEGICQISVEISLSINIENNDSNDKKSKEPKMKWYKCFLAKPTIIWASKYCFNDEDNNPMKTFIADFEKVNDTYLINSNSKLYSAVKICANVIETKNRKSIITYYRDHSYILQVLRITFLLISLMTLLFMLLLLNIDLIVTFIYKTKLFKNIDDCKSLFTFGVVIFILSIGILFLTTSIAHSFSKRYIREVGFAYEALRFNFYKKYSPINMVEDNLNEKA